MATFLCVFNKSHALRFVSKRLVIKEKLFHQKTRDFLQSSPSSSSVDCSVVMVTACERVSEGGWGNLWSMLWWCVMLLVTCVWHFDPRHPHRHTMPCVFVREQNRKRHSCFSCILLHKYTYYSTHVSDSIMIYQRQFNLLFLKECLYYNFKFNSLRLLRILLAL